MKKFLILALFFTINTNAFSFETGKYHGSSPDGTQTCDLDITQHEASYIINSLECEDQTLGRKFGGGEPKELEYGKTKKYFKQFKMTMTIDVSANKYTMNYSNKKLTESYDEELSVVDDKLTHFKFSITHENVFYSWFDLDMAMIEKDKEF